MKCPKTWAYNIIINTPARIIIRQWIATIQPLLNNQGSQYNHKVSIILRLIIDRVPLTYSSVGCRKQGRTRLILTLLRWGLLTHLINPNSCLSEMTRRLSSCEGQDRGPRSRLKRETQKSLRVQRWQQAIGWSLSLCHSYAMPSGIIEHRFKNWHRQTSIKRHNCLNFRNRKNFNSSQSGTNVNNSVNWSSFKIRLRYRKRCRAWRDKPNWSRCKMNSYYSSKIISSCKPNWKR